MTAWKLDDIGANAASNSLRPVGVDNPILTANHGSAAHRGMFGQRARHVKWVSGLGAKMINGSGNGRFVAVGVEHLPDEIEVDPHSSKLLVGLTQPLQPSVGKICTNHVGLRLPLVKHANSTLWNRGAQIHQMPHWAPI